MDGRDSAGGEDRHESEEKPTVKQRDLNAQLATLRMHYRNIIILILSACFILFALVGVGVGLSLYQVHALATQSNAGACDFFGDLASLPITTPEGISKPSRFGVQLVSDSRKSWHTFNCTGPEHKPDPTFVRWARYYKVPIN